MMFKLSILVLLAPLARAITFTTPNNLTSGGQATVTWTSDSSDPPVFSLYLLNQVFHNSFGISNNVQTSSGTITLELPAVPPGDGYTLEATNITDINQMFGTSASFSIGATISTTASSSSTSLVSPSASGSSGSSAFATPSGSVSQSNTGSSSGNSGSTGASEVTDSSSSSNPSATAFNGNGGSNGAVPNSIGSWLAMVVAAVAGGAFAL